MSPYAQRLLARQASPSPAADRSGADVEVAFSAADSNHDGKIDHQEFVDWYARMNQTPKKGASKSNPVSSEISKALEKKILARPDHSVLKAKNVLHDDHDLSHSPKIVASTKALKAAFKKDVLHQAVRARPPISALHARGILKPEFARDKVDPSLIQPMQALQKSFKKDVLSQALRSRPTHDDLHKKGILHEDHKKSKMDAKLVKPSMDLAKAFKKDYLSQQLARRSSVEQLKAKNILHESHEVVHGKLAAPTKKLQKAFKQDILSQQIRGRKSLTELHEQGVVDMSHPTFASHPEVESTPVPADEPPAVVKNNTGAATKAAAGPSTSSDADMDLKSCLVEVQRALKNLRELRGWLEKIPN